MIEGDMQLSKVFTKIRYIVITLFFFNLSVLSIHAQQEQRSVNDSTQHKVNTPHSPNTQNPISLTQPKNITNEVDYDPASGQYIFKKTLGEMVLETPYGMSPAEYSDYRMKKSLEAYWHARNMDTTKTQQSNTWLLNTLNSAIPGINDIFGGSGFNISAQGAVDLNISVKRSFIDNPSLPEHLRTVTNIDFDQNIRASVHGQLGNSVRLGIDYNTQATFDFDTRVNLRYEGDEDEIIKVIEAGNVSLPLSSSLIQGSQSLMGIKSVLQFGRMTVSSVFSQQKAETKTITLEGGTQSIPFSLAADQYDANRHFFLSHFFRDNYEDAVKKMPQLASGVQITRIEVWVTNKRGRFDQSRNVLAFSDLGETTKISNSNWTSNANTLTDNNANTLYSTITRNYSDIRDVGKINQSLSDPALGIQVGIDYEKLEAARLLDQSEYILNPTLGYISLTTTLNNDEILSVAYEYTYRGKVYRVGELSSDGVTAPNTLVTKLLKGASLSPAMPYWDLMMKNVYAIGGNGIEIEDFKFYIAYEDDVTGVDLQVVPSANIQNKPLLSVMGLDRRNSLGERFSDGYFDRLEGISINSQYGRIFFPVLEPFGSHLAKQIDNPTDAEKYCFQELYDNTLVEARQFAEKNKFKMFGEFKASSNAEIYLNTINITEGSVNVTAGGVTLVENVDYTVDYNLGRVQIINQGLLASGTTIKVNLESQALFNMQQKTMLGTHIDYEFSKNLTVGGTFMHMYERPFTEKVSIGNEPIANSIWGLNASYRTESQFLTTLLDKLPLLNLKEKSSINLNAEFAQLIPGTSKSTGKLGTAYLDDFESTKTAINIKHFLSWQLSSVPEGQDDMFPEAKLYNDRDYGKNRARLAWYNIDPLFNRQLSSTPGYVSDDVEMRSNHYTREVRETEIWPNRQQVYGDAIYISTLDLAYYPEERGPYNFDTRPGVFSAGLSNTGQLKSPESRWAGITRKITTSDFEANNIEYIEFWVMDPFIYTADDPEAGGDLYFNLGNISEDILKDGKKYFENGLPITGNFERMDTSAWGLVPKEQALVNAFSNESGARALQDLGLDGLNDSQEKLFFATYLEEINTFFPQISSNQAVLNDPNSPVNDPAGDNFHYFRGSNFERNKTPILNCYKYINNPQGNSSTTENSPEPYATAMHNYPDGEDLNGDNTLNSQEAYYQYKISLRPQDMQVGQNFITDRVESTVTLPNASRETVTWYQFKIPVHKPEKVVGDISGFNSIRFMRMFMTGFKKESFLRFATLELARSDWRVYDKTLLEDGSIPTLEPSISVTAVSLEENADRTPINYVLPPGIERSIDPNQRQIREMDEQSLSLRIQDLSPKNAKAVYKNLHMDMRQYKRLQMFAHAEALEGEILNDNELTTFIRLGSDFTDNYYEYEVPMHLTQYGENAREKVWPASNFFDVEFAKFHKLKLRRNSVKNHAGSNITFQTPYTELDPDDPSKRITVKGNPNTGEVKTIMIGVRNRSGETRSIEVWVNELRLVDTEKEGGHAANMSASIRLSDFGIVNIGGMMESAGFGGLEQPLNERSQEDYYEYNVSTNLQLGKLFPEKAKVQLPTYFAYSKSVSTPKYNPIDPDIKLQDALNAANKEERDSIRQLSETVESTKSLNISNARVNIRSKKPMPYDPANFAFSYSYVENKYRDPRTQGELNKNYTGHISYTYAPNTQLVEPLKNAKTKVLNTKSLQLIKDFNFNYLPKRVFFITGMRRQYNEYQIRDFSNTPGGLEAQVRKEFFWERELGIDYDLTRSLQLQFSNRSNAIIDEPYKIHGKSYIINKDLYPDEYQVWKDSVLRSIKNFGRTTDFVQQFSASYQIPFQKIPLLDWIQGSANYAASYSWLAAPRSSGDDLSIDSIVLGNTIENTNSIGLSTTFNLKNLYDKVGFLKGLNKASAKPERIQPHRGSNQSQQRRYEDRLNLKKDEELIVSHKLQSSKVRIRAYHNNRPVTIQHKVKDKNTLTINSSKSYNNLRVIISTTEPIEQDKQNIFAQLGLFAVKLAIGFKNVDINYNENNATSLSGYMPEVGFWGQGSMGQLRTPGLKFAFGLQDDEWGQKAAQNKLLSPDIEFNTPYFMSHQNELKLRASYTPVPDFIVRFTASRIYSETHTEYLTNRAPYYEAPFLAGRVSMTYLALGSSFWKINNTGDYSSEFFNRLQENRMIVAQRFAKEKERAGARYPSTGEFQGMTYAGQAYQADRNADGTYNPEGIAGVDMNSPEILVPAFLAAVADKNASNSSMDIIPKITSLLPNWSITYTGLSRIKFLKQHFNNISLSHTYQCHYDISSFASNPSFNEHPNGLGMVQDLEGNNKPVFLSNYTIPSITMVENFSPLLRVDVSMKNNFMFNIGLHKMRTLNLNLPSNQLVERHENRTNIGIGYTLNDFDLFLGKGASSKKVTNDLTLKADISFEDLSSFTRRIDENYSQITEGGKSKSWSIRADYVLTQNINIGLFYDKLSKLQRLSSYFNTASSQFGVSFRFILNER